MQHSSPRPAELMPSESAQRQAQPVQGIGRSVSDSARPRSDGKWWMTPFLVLLRANQGRAESWVEIASQPSSSSLSSSAAADEIVTTGLRVRRHSNIRRSRRLELRGPSQPSLLANSSSAGSSQEEYEDSESDEDEPALPQSSHLGVSPPLPATYESTFDEDDNDENTTALGTRTNTVFTPQPNAFSHPPSSQPNAEAVPGSYFPRQNGSGRPHRNSYPSRRTPQHTPYNFISPSYQADHDAALRASLSTLLSCAAAARGLSKATPAAGAAARSVPSSSRPSAFRIVPESVVDGANDGDDRGLIEEACARKPSSSSSSSDLVLEKGKRKSGSYPGKSGKERATKKTRRGVEDTISPTLLTWVVSAGVVVIVSAIGFSAGYAMGREAGLAEVGFTNTTDGGDCGREAFRGLRKFRWSTSGASSVSV
ncbi:MAG: hypothetical protein M1838_000532 [Thelocarpon superellum]|nr:MAG: hypothetical protein M1838_000532 [Thelocarpon superellum]